MTESLLASDAGNARLARYAEDARRIHDLKCWPQFFEAIAQGRKRARLTSGLRP